MGKLGISLLLGFGLGLCNLYVALQLGFSIGVAFQTALCWGLLDRLARWLAPDRARIANADYACYLSLTSSMSYGSATIIATSLSGVFLAGAAPSSWTLVLWVAGLCGLGTCLAYPLRRFMLEAYPFPSGRAAADLVVQVQGQGTSKSFIPTLLFTWVWLALCKLLPSIGLVLSRLPVLLRPEASPLLLGLGALLGLKVALSTAAGTYFAALVGWARPDWLDHQLWFAIGMILSATAIEFMGLWFSNRKVQSFAFSFDGYSRTWVAALLGSMMVLWLSYGWGWQLDLKLLPLLLILGIAFVFISCAVTGQTDIVPVGSLGKLSLLIFSLFQGSVVTRLIHTGTLTGAAAASADFVNDLRMGAQLGCKPERQFRYQFLGAILGAVLFVPLFLALVGTELGSARFPVPAAKIWLGVADLGGAFERHGSAIGWGLAWGLILALASKLPRLTWLPAPIPFAMAAVLDPSVSLTLCLGALLQRGLGSRANPQVWSALICGDALAQMVLIALGSV